MHVTHSQLLMLSMNVLIKFKGKQVPLRKGNAKFVVPSHGRFHFM